MSIVLATACFSLWGPVGPAHSANPANPPTIVRPGSLNGWVVDASNNAASTFVGGPATPPLGTGSLEMDTKSLTGGRPRAVLAGAPVAGTGLADLTRLTYQVFTHRYATEGNWLAIYLVLHLNLDPGVVGGVPASVVFEQCYSSPGNCAAPVQPLDTWTTFDALGPTSAPTIWWSFDPVLGGGANPVFKPLGQLVLASHPQAIVTDVRIQAGQRDGGAPWDDYVGSVDDLVMAADGSQPLDMTVNFELDAPVVATTTTTLAVVALMRTPPTTVATADPPVLASTNQALPFTGSDTEEATLLGYGLASAGLVLVYLGRRRFAHGRRRSGRRG